MAAAGGVRPCKYAREHIAILISTAAFQHSLYETPTPHKEEERKVREAKAERLGEAK